MSFTQTYHLHGGGTVYDDYWPSCSRNGSGIPNRKNIHSRNNNSYNDFSRNSRDLMNSSSYGQPDGPPSLKRRKFSTSTWGESARHFVPPTTFESAPLICNNPVIPPTSSYVGVSSSTTSKRNRSQLEDEEVVFMSRDEIERCSPSKKDGIDALREAHLRYSYCAFLQNLGIRLELPQTTIGTAMVLCHRFFVRRSHACHDRFLIATAALFLAAKSEEAARPLNDVLRASCEIYHKRDITFLSYLLPIDWFEQYRERVTEAEQLILTTLNFELNVQHPYDPLTSILNKLGLSRPVLVDLALSLVSAGVYTRLACWPV